MLHYSVIIWNVCSLQSELKPSKTSGDMAIKITPLANRTLQMLWWGCVRLTMDILVKLSVISNLHSTSAWDCWQLVLCCTYRSLKNIRNMHLLSSDYELIDSIRINSTQQKCTHSIVVGNPDSCYCNWHNPKWVNLSLFYSVCNSHSSRKGWFINMHNSYNSFVLIPTSLNSRTHFDSHVTMYSCMDDK